MPADRYMAGFSTLEAGMNGGISPSLIPANQFALGQNITNRKGFATTRPPWKDHYLSPVGNAVTTWSGRFQGHCPYNDGQGRVGWVVSRGGYLFFIDGLKFTVEDITPTVSVTVTSVFTVPAVNGNVVINVTLETPFTIGQVLTIDSGSYTVVNRIINALTLTYTGGAAHATVAAGSSILSGGNQVQAIEPNPPTMEFAFLFQAEYFVVVLAGQNNTIIWNGANSRRTGVREIPPGYLGVYGNGRIWIALPNRVQFLAGDIVGGSSGTAQNGFRDAIIKFTENDYLNEGGAFSVPANAGLINSMQFLATQDTSLGMGPLLVGTTNSVFSVNAPTDRTTWKALTYPIQTIALIDYGPLAPNGAVSVNGDMWYRSLAGIQSFIVSRRNFPSPGNTPMSREMAPVLDNDQQDLLPFGSGMLFDNRLLMTVSPVRNTSGITHRGLAAINFDSISNLQGKSAPCWEGVWTGLPILQASKILINGNERGFAFAQGSGDDVQLWELQKSGDSIADTFVTFPGDTIVESPIQCALETRAESYGGAGLLFKLITSVFYFDDIAGTIPFTVKYRPDQYPAWITWKTFNLCAQNVEQCQINPPGQIGCTVWKPYARLYAARIMMPKPSDDCVPGMIIPQPPRLAHELQFRFEWTGHLRIRRFESHVSGQPQPTDGACPDDLSCASFQDCGTNLYTYLIPN